MAAKCSDCPFGTGCGCPHSSAADRDEEHTVQFGIFSPIECFIIDETAFDLESRIEGRSLRFGRGVKLKRNMHLVGMLSTATRFHSTLRAASPSSPPSALNLTDQSASTSSVCHITVICTCPSRRGAIPIWRYGSTINGERPDSLVKILPAKCGLAATTKGTGGHGHQAALGVYRLK